MSLPYLCKVAMAEPGGFGRSRSRTLWKFPAPPSLVGYTTDDTP